MNYLTEIKLFYEWLETHPLSAQAIAVWHALMYIANRSGWQEDLKVPLSLLELRSGVPLLSIYRVRKQLEDAGRVVVSNPGGRSSGIYRIVYLQDQDPEELALQLSLHTASITAVQSDVQSAVQDAVQTQNSQLGVHTASQNASIYKQDIHISSSKKDKKKKVEEVEGWLAQLPDPWQEMVRGWFEYKASRKENYKSVLAAQKWLSMLRNYSGGNPDTAQQIIDKAMANNWAGIHQLAPGESHTGPPPLNQGPQRGQRIGQILQPSSETKRQELLDKFNKK